MLSRLDVGRLVVVGAQTDACIRSSLHGALVGGFDVTLVSDAHTNLYWTYPRAPGRKAGTGKTRDVDFDGAT